MTTYNTQTLLVQTGLSVAVDGGSRVIKDVNQLESYTIFAKFDMSGGATSAGNVLIQISLDDGVTWSAVQGSTLAYTSATTAHSWEFQTPSHVMSRVFVDYSSGAGGTMDIYVARKGLNN
jgi:hypothetical protein